MMLFIVQYINTFSFSILHIYSYNLKYLYKVRLNLYADSGLIVKLSHF